MPASLHSLDNYMHFWRLVKAASLYLSAPLYLRTLWRYTNAVIIIIIKFV